MRDLLLGGGLATLALLFGDWWRYPRFAWMHGVFTGVVIALCVGVVLSS